jgi:hypothetical protein
VTDTVPEPHPEQPLNQRVSSLETGQQTLTEKIDELLGIVKSGHDDKPSAPTTTADPAPAADMTEQMAEAIRKVQAETAAAAPTTPKPEQPPREAGQPFRERLGHAIHGKPPKERK